MPYGVPANYVSCLCAFFPPIPFGVVDGTQHFCQQSIGSRFSLRSSQSPRKLAHILSLNFQLHCSKASAHQHTNTHTLFPKASFFRARAANRILLVLLLSFYIYPLWPATLLWRAFLSLWPQPPPTLSHPAPPPTKLNRTLPLGEDMRVPSRNELLLILITCSIIFSVPLKLTSEIARMTIIHAAQFDTASRFQRPPAHSQHTQMATVLPAFAQSIMFMAIQIV